MWYEYVFLIYCLLYLITTLGLPLLRTVACVGGTAMKDQLETIKG
jgi:hypothetical protein